MNTSFTVKIPGSTSNLGAGFDCFGLALEIYLTVKVKIKEGPDPCVITVETGAESAAIPTTPVNLIFQTALATARTLNKELPPIALDIRNEIPLGRGLGSSAAAIVAGVSIGANLCGTELSPTELLDRAALIEGHADNVAASVLGRRVICYQDIDSGFRAVRLPWPEALRVIIVSPESELATKQARAVLPDKYSRADAVFDLQRTALFTAALDHLQDQLIWEAMQDRLHQPYREHLIPGLAAALATPRQEGLLGLALSGAGPSVVALARDNFEAIGASIAKSFQEEGLGARVRVLNVDQTGVEFSFASS